MTDITGFVTPPPVGQLTHDPCCSAHGARLDCESYRRSHFVQIGPCCDEWAREHPEYGTASNPKAPTIEAPTTPPTIDEHLASVAAYRAKGDDVTAALSFLGDKLAEHVAKKMPGEDTERIGLVIVQAGAAATSLVNEGMSAAAVINVLLLAGERMVAEARGRKTAEPPPPFQVGDEVLWRWHEDGGSGRWFKARLVEHHPAGYPKGWSGDVTDRGTFYDSSAPGWDAPIGHNVFLDEPSMTLVHRPSKGDDRG